jgi:hypothetical protein
MLTLFEMGIVFAISPISDDIKLLTTKLFSAIDAQQ